MFTDINMYSHLPGASCFHDCIRLGTLFLQYMFNGMWICWFVSKLCFDMLHIMCCSSGAGVCSREPCLRRQKLSCLGASSGDFGSICRKNSRHVAQRACIHRASYKGRCTEQFRLEPPLLCSVSGITRLSCWDIHRNLQQVI